jgi:hypothetical protein
MLRSDPELWLVISARFKCEGNLPVGYAAAPRSWSIEEGEGKSVGVVKALPSAIKVSKISRSN